MKDLEKHLQARLKDFLSISEVLCVFGSGQSGSS